MEGEINRDRGAKEVLDKYPGIKIVADPVADWIQAKAKDRMTEVLRAQPKIDVVYGHNDPMAIGAYLAAKELGREKEMIFVGVDGLGGPADSQVMDGILALRPLSLCVDKAAEIGSRILLNGFPAEEYVLRSLMVTPGAAQVCDHPRTKKLRRSQISSPASMYPMPRIWRLRAAASVFASSRSITYEFLREL